MPLMLDLYVIVAQHKSIWLTFISMIQIQFQLVHFAWPDPRLIFYTRVILLIQKTIMKGLVL